ncbi:MAG: hypothetical protein WC641_06400 [Patescibacteria group bacterium]
MKSPFITRLFIVTSVLFVLSLIVTLFIVSGKLVLVPLAIGVVAASLNVCMVIRERKRLSQAPPFRATLSLMERMRDLGLEFSHHSSEMEIAGGIRDYFVYTAGPPLCQYCQSYADEVVCGNAAINPSKLGFFCTSCGCGRLYNEVNAVRKHVALPALPNGNLFGILNVLERDALEKGIIHAPVAEAPKLPEATSFCAVIQHTGDFRNAPLKVKVDVTAQSVSVIEGELTERPDSNLRRIK